MPRNRTYPSTGLSHDSKFWGRVLDISQRVAVYFPTNVVESVNIVGYYSTVSEANTAAYANIKPNGSMPIVRINWWHPDISHYGLYPNAAEALPTWIDEDPV
jgi:hypothetical protein